jgi:hypothetical protein
MCLNAWMPRSWGIVAGLLLVGMCQPAQAQVGAAAAYARLSSLAGAWRAVAPNAQQPTLVFRLTAAGSALVESFLSPTGRETLTIFHRDNAQLLATHYCAQGNQPRLELDPSSTPERLVFRYRDATNLHSNADTHLVRLELALSGDSSFTMVEIYEASGTLERTETRFERTKPAGLARAQPAR